MIGRESVRAGIEPAPARRRRASAPPKRSSCSRSSKHLQIIALVISFAVDRRGDHRAAAEHGGGGAEGRRQPTRSPSFLATVGLWTSTIGFVIQVWLTSKIHRYLGIGFALMVLPVSLGSTGVIMLLNGALWAPALARVLDQSLRYTVDKTTREILFLPLPGDIKLKAKSFVDVTVDRGAKAAGALLLLVLVKPWGLQPELAATELSPASVMTVLWVLMALRARRGYLQAFRQSMATRDVPASELRLNVADLSTIETLVQELAHPDPARVVYAIDVLESLDKRNLVTPLLLYHESRGGAAAGARRRSAPSAARSREQWVPHIRRMLGDPDPGVRRRPSARWRRSAHEDAASLARPMLADPDPRIRATAAVALAGSAKPEDLDDAERRAARSDRRHARRDARRAARRRDRDPADRRSALPPAADSAALRSGARSRRRSDGERARRRRQRLRVRADARLAAAQPPPQGTRPRRRSSATASRWSTRSRTSCAIRTRTSGCAGTSRARWRRSRRRSRSTCWSPRSRSATGSSATRSCRRSSGSGASIPS